MRPPWLPLQNPCFRPPLFLLPRTLPAGLGATRRHLTLRNPTVASPAVASGCPRSNAKGDGSVQQLTARERRQLRNERRESHAAAAGSWREEVEEKLLHRPKKRDKASWKEELNLDNLSLLGPQWWVVRVSRVTGQDTAEGLARALARNYPDMDFKVYFPAVKVKRRLKNGSYSFKSNPFFPGCVFLYCVLNKDLHDFVRECDGVGGFFGSKVGNTKRQINKPKPVEAGEMEAIFHQARQEQEVPDQSFEREQVDVRSAGEQNVDSHLDFRDKANLKTDVKPKRQSTKGLETNETGPSRESGYKFIVPGTSVRVLSGPFIDYVGHLKQLDQKAGKASIGIVMFGKETFVEVAADGIVAEST